jgi:diaminopimelate epimerase
MRYFNSDGLESTMCGNGGRCIIAFADFLSLTKEKIRFLASDGEHTGSIISRNKDDYRIRLSMKDVTGIDLRGHDLVIDTGSPHLVRFVGDLSVTDVVSEGRKVRFHEDFRADGINVNFVQNRQDDIFVRTYERGVEDETLSCGTGVTAAALAHASRTGLKEGKISVSTPGGNLSVEFKHNGQFFSDIWLEGPVRKVFRGIIEI